MWLIEILERIGDLMVGDGPPPHNIRSPTGLLAPSVNHFIEPALKPVDPARCPSGPVGCLCASLGGKHACRLLNQWAVRHACPVSVVCPSLCKCPLVTPAQCRREYHATLPTLNVGTFSISDFAGSPQQHAILNRHLLDYFRDRQRANETTPYAIPPSQQHLLPGLGMEEPQPDAPVVPHALHKSIELAQLSRMRNYLAPGSYTLVCAKTAKVSRLPQPERVINPIRQAKDASRFPGSSVRDASFAHNPTTFLHDVAGEVTPHELVEKLIRENPEGHLFVTGMTPIEVNVGARSFEPASHSVEYRGAGYNFIFTDSESESYFTPVRVTTAWLNTSAIVASNGRTYHVVLLDYKLGHALYHVFCGDVEEQSTRTFSTGSYVYLPPAVSGTLRGEYVPSKLLTAALDFVYRTPDLSTRNLAAKVTMVANVTNPKATARERWVVRHVMEQLAPHRTWATAAARAAWLALYAITLQWQMLTPVPDIYHYVNERSRTITLHPTRGGGWSPSYEITWTRESIPNNPTVLQQVSAFTASAFIYLWPKLLLGEVFSSLVFSKSLWSVVSTVVSWFHFEPLRLLLTAAVVLVGAIVPGHVVARLMENSSHYWRQLWWPGWVATLLERAVVELSGAPGAVVFTAPGGGWCWQALIWAVALHSVIPGLVPALVVPWIALTHGWSALMVPWLAGVVLENGIVALPRPLIGRSTTVMRRRFIRSWRVLPRLDCSWSLYRSHPVIESGERIVRRRVPVPSSRGPASGIYTTRTPVARTVRSAVYPCLNPTLNCLFGGLSVKPRGVGVFMTAIGNDSLDCLRAAAVLGLLALSRLHEWAVRTQRATGNCGRVPGLPALPPPPKPTIVKRNVDRVLPTVVVQPHLPSPPAGDLLAVPPHGMDFPDWLAQVQAAYRANPNAHPMLTPGSDCFWQCVASLGGTPHMWFSWFQAFMRRKVPANQTRVGGTTLVDMGLFASISGIGIRYTGVADEVVPPAPGRPVLHMRVTHVPLTTDLHVELATAPVTTAAVSDLARILRTLQLWYPAWANDFVSQFQAAPVDSVPVPSPELLAIAGAHEVPRTLSEIADAVLGSFVVQPFTTVRPDGFVLDQVNAPAVGVKLYTYVAPVSRLNVAGKSAAEMWLKFKNVGTSARQHRDNASRNNMRPEAPMWHQLMAELTKKVADYSQGVLPCVPLQEEVVMFTADVDRAARLISDLKACPSALGAKYDPKVLQSLDSVVDLFRLERKTVTVPVRLYLGVGGCGKTTATAAYLATLSPDLRSATRIVSHTESLRAQSKLALDYPEMRGVNFPTLPSLIAEPTTGPIVFDDAGKFYGGVLDLVLLTNPLVPEVVVNGDPAQALSKFPVSGTQSEYDEGPMVVAKQATKYATLSHRFFTLLASMLGVHTSNPTRGHITHTVSPKPGLPVTTASPRYVQVLASAGREAYTHDTVQGQDFKTDVEVDMSALEEAASDRTAYVALTRSSTGVYLHMNAADPRSIIKAPPTGSDLMNAILYSMKADNSATLYNGNPLIRATFYAHLHAAMPNLVWFSNVGTSLCAGRYQSVAAVSNSSLPVDSPVADTTVRDQDPVSAAEAETAIHEPHPWDKSRREVGCAGISTDQFKEVAFVNPHVHKRGDHATYKLTVQKRITNATPAANYTRKKSCPRSDMCDEFDRLVPHPPLWSPEKHVEYADRARVEYEQGRTAAAVQAKLASHDPDRKGTDVVNSIKSQVIRKDEKRDKVTAIPGQLIYEYDLSQTMEDAAYALFLEDEVIPAFPERFLFYRRMNPQQFAEAYRRRWRVGNGVHTSDVTRWDVGCDAGVLNFDEHVMRRCGFPGSYVDAYVRRRLSTSTQHGELATSQPSGDRYTWTLNSIRRAIVTSLVLDVVDGDTAAINGDDAALDRFAYPRPFPDSPWEFKFQNGAQGEFSGFLVGGPEPRYSARGVHYRAMILESRDPSAVDKWTNYLELAAMADPDSWEALDVFRMAERHLARDLFVSLLPPHFLPHFV